MDKIYDINTYDYYLPESQIAQFPIEPRDHSRLLVYNKNNKTKEDLLWKKTV